MFDLALIGAMELVPILVILIVFAGIVVFVARLASRKQERVDVEGDRIDALEREVRELRRTLERERSN